VTKRWKWVFLGETMAFWGTKLQFWEKCVNVEKSDIYRGKSYFLPEKSSGSILLEALLLVKMYRFKYCSKNANFSTT